MTTKFAENNFIRFYSLFVRLIQYHRQCMMWRDAVNTLNGWLAPNTVFQCLLSATGLQRTVYKKQNSLNLKLNSVIVNRQETIVYLLAELMIFARIFILFSN